VDNCANVSCLNGGVCRSSLLNYYTCDCLGSSYSGRHCEVSSRTLERQALVSRSLSVVAIVAMSMVVAMVVSMDVLKYCFGVDSVEKAEEDDRPTRRRRSRADLVGLRYVYVSGPAEWYEGGSQA
jgi:hypothetical protein